MMNTSTAIAGPGCRFCVYWLSITPRPESVGTRSSANTSKPNAIGMATRVATTRLGVIARNTYR